MSEREKKLHDILVLCVLRFGQTQDNCFALAALVAYRILPTASQTEAIDYVEENSRRFRHTVVATLPRQSNVSTLASFIRSSGLAEALKSKKAEEFDGSRASQSLRQIAPELAISIETHDVRAAYDFRPKSAETAAACCDVAPHQCPRHELVPPKPVKTTNFVASRRNTCCANSPLSSHWQPHWRFHRPHWLGMVVAMAAGMVAATAAGVEVMAAVMAEVGEATAGVGAIPVVVGAILGTVAAGAIPVGMGEAGIGTGAGGLTAQARAGGGIPITPAGSGFATDGGGD